MNPPVTGRGALHEADPGVQPPRRSEEPERKSHGWVWFLVLLAVALSGYYFVTHGRQGATTAAKAPGVGSGRVVPVVAVAAARGNMGVYLDGIGNATAFNTVTVRTRVDGELTRVAFQEGQLVNQGDLLVEIDPRPYQVQLEQAQGQMARDAATLNNAKVDLARYQVLMAQDAIPKQQLDTQEATVRQAEGNIKTDQATIDNAKLQLVYCEIHSPITGRIGLRLVDQGNQVHATDVNGLAVITQLQPIAVIFSIAENYLPEVTKKLRAGARLPVEAWDHDKKTKLATGELLTIDNQVDQNTGSVKFKGVFANVDNSLFPNQFVNARLLLDTKRGVVIVPAAAIQRSPDSMFVYVVKPDSTVEVRDVVSSLTEGDQAAVDSGLAPGEMVVIDGVDKLQPGSRVSVNGAAPKGGGAGKGKGKKG